MDMNDKLLRRLLIDAALEKAEEDEREFKPSDRFKITLNKNLKANGIKPYYSFLSIKRHRALVITAAVIAAFALSMSVGAIRERVVNFFVEMFDTFAVITTYKNVDYPETIEEQYAPTYLPEGYVACDEMLTRFDYSIRYENGNHEIVCTQFVKNTVTNVDNERYFEKICIFDDYDGLLWGTGDEITIFFERYEYYFTISTYGEISENDLIKMAKSLEKVELTKN